VVGRKYYVTAVPQGSIVLYAIKVWWIALKNKGNLEVARPSYQAHNGQKYKTPWPEEFVDELRRSLVACRVFIFYPIYWVCYGQMVVNIPLDRGEGTD
jgi:proton-dependent oligopeptide transporter, POT family